MQVYDYIVCVCVCVPRCVCVCIIILLCVFLCMHSYNMCVRACVCVYKVPWQVAPTCSTSMPVDLPCISSMLKEWLTEPAKLLTVH